MGDLTDWPEPIHVIGAGGIGCQVILALHALGAQHITVWDDDIVERHNLPMQSLYRPSDIGKYKADAACDYLIRQESRTSVTARRSRIGTSDRTKLQGIVISGVDSMASRSDIWQSIRLNVYVDAYFDLRVGGDAYELHAPNPVDATGFARYESWLFEDTDANDRGCVTREKPYSATAVSAELSHRLSLFAEGERTEDSVHRVFSRESRVRQPAGT